MTILYRLFKCLEGQLWKFGAVCFSRLLDTNEQCQSIEGN